MPSIIEKKFTKPIENKGLSYKQIKFIDEYILCGVIIEAVKNAGYKGDDKKLAVTGSTLMANPKIQAEIQRRKAEIHSATILSANELLEMYSKIARGEVLDQFGLDASLKDRIAAMKELAKYQLDIPMKLAEKQQADNTLTVKLIRD